MPVMPSPSLRRTAIISSWYDRASHTTGTSTCSTSSNRNTLHSSVWITWRTSFAIVPRMVLRSSEFTTAWLTSSNAANCSFWRFSRSSISASVASANACDASVEKLTNQPCTRPPGANGTRETTSSRSGRARRRTRSSSSACPCDPCDVPGSQQPSLPRNNSGSDMPTSTSERSPASSRNAAFAEVMRSSASVNTTGAGTYCRRGESSADQSSMPERAPGRPWGRMSATIASPAADRGTPSSVQRASTWRVTCRNAVESGSRNDPSSSATNARASACAVSGPSGLSNGNAMASASRVR